VHGKEKAEVAEKKDACSSKWRTGASKQNEKPTLNKFFFIFTNV